MPSAARALAALTLLLAGACAAATDPAPEVVTAQVADAAGRVRVRACTGPAASLSDALAGRLPAAPPAGQGNSDDRLAAATRGVPGGFAGVFYEANGARPVLLLVDPSRAAEAKAALAAELRGFDLAAAEPRAARWTFAQLYDWKRYLYTQDIWAGGDLTLADIDEQANRLYLGAADAAARDRLAARLEALALPCDLVLVGVSGRPVLL